MRKTKVKMNKPVYLGMSILHISKTLTYEFWYDYIKSKYGDNEKYINIKTEGFYEDIANDLEKRLNESNYEIEYNSIDRPLPTGKNKKVIGLMKDELGGKIMTQFITLRPKTYAYLMDGGNSDSDTHVIKKVKGTQKHVIKKELKFNDYKDCLLNNEIVLKSQQRFKSERHDVYTEEINKIALSSNDDKRLQTFHKITSYPYGTSAGRVCKSELLSKSNIK